jgi:3-oxoacyl-[acyl-carrier protein] reductase
VTSEFAEQGVVVNSVSPSMVDTRFLRDIPEKAKELAAAASPLGRNATPDEVAEVLEAFLATDRPMVNGVNLVMGAGALR